MCMIYFVLCSLGIRGIFKTLCFNLKYLPIKQGIRFPVLLSKEVIVNKCYRGGVKIEAPARCAMIRIGLTGRTMLNITPCHLYLEGVLTFKGKAKIGIGTRIHIVQGGVLELGDEFAVTGNSFFDVRKYMRFGRRCLLSYDNLFMDNDGEHKIYNENGVQINNHKEVFIGDHVWIGSRCTILKGTKIPNECVIASNSVVSGELKVKQAVYAGNKAILCKQGIVWEK